MWLVIKLYGSGAEDAFKYYLCLTSGNLFIGFTCVADAFYIYSGNIRLAVRINFVLAALAMVGIYLGGKWFEATGVAAAAGLVDSLGLFHLVYMWLYFRRARLRQPSPPSTQGIP
jgi:O-antigen/teichoic acid export membrane protein